jgi:predicted CXXCH cytochrome family protein
VEQGECTTCHDPHSGDAPLLFAKPRGIDLCAGCHDYATHQSHPIGEKIRDPRNKNLTLECLSCHRAHGTEYKRMMPFTSTSDLCVRCHQQFRR